jgi:1,4-alpha-glucan branching enzyme
VTALQPLPLVEFQGEWSLGYNGSDLFSPEMDYCVEAAELTPICSGRTRCSREREALAHGGAAERADQSAEGADRHLSSLRPRCDPVRGLQPRRGGFDPQSIDHFDFPAQPDHTNSLYFSDDDWAGGRVFAFDRHPGA